jgi:nicotinamide riboside transporter PnuC
MTTLSWIIFPISLAAYWLLIRKNRWGMALGILRESGFVVLSLSAQQFGVTAAAVIFGTMSVYGFIRWDREDAKSKS